MLNSEYSFVIFFFQAEDGIRDYKVTGVQTCALPISRLLHQLPGATALRSGPSWPRSSSPSALRRRGSGGRPRRSPRRRRPSPRARAARSEERRVGEEGRSRGAPDHLKKKKKGTTDLQ